MSDLLPPTLKKLQGQLIAAIRAHRNLVGKMNLDPLNGALLLKVRQAELLIERIYLEQKPLLDRFHKEVNFSKNGLVKSPCLRVSLSQDEIIEDKLHRHFCPTTLEKLQSAVTKMSPDKKRKINFMALFDVIPPNIVEDIKEARNYKRKRKMLVNSEFPVPALQETGRRAKVNNGSSDSVVVSVTEGIRTRSSRRAKTTNGGSHDFANDYRLSRHGSSNTKRESDKLSDASSDRFCCAKCQKVLQLQTNRVLGIIYWCSNCKVSTSGRVCHVPVSLQSDESSKSPLVLENQVLRAEAEHWHKSILHLEAKRQKLMERNNCSEKHLTTLVSQLVPKTNGIKQSS